MGSVEVIVGNPTFGFSSDLVETSEGANIKYIVAIVTVATLDEAVLGGFARSDVLDGNAGMSGPSLEYVAGELGPIVQAEVPGAPRVLMTDLFEDANDSLGGQRDIDFDGKRLAVVVVDQVEGVIAHPGGEGIATFQRTRMLGN